MELKKNNDTCNQKHDLMLNQQTRHMNLNIQLNKRSMNIEVGKKTTFQKRPQFQFLILLFFIYINAFSQQHAPIKYVDKLAEQKKVLIHNYPGVFNQEEIKNIDSLDSKHSKIFYVKDNVNYETVVNSNRKDLLLVATCKQITEEALPAIVKNGFHTSKYGSHKIEKTFIVTTPYTTNFYRIDVITKQKNMKSLFYDDKGLYMKPPY